MRILYNNISLKSSEQIKNSAIYKSEAFNCLTYIILYINIPATIPIILDMLILNKIENDSCIMLKSNCNGVVSPNVCEYPNHHKKSTFAAISPNNPPNTSPANINTIKIQLLFPLTTAIFVTSLSLLLYSIIIIVFWLGCNSKFNF